MSLTEKLKTAIKIGLIGLSFILCGCENSQDKLYNQYKKENTQQIKTVQKQEERSEKEAINAVGIYFDSFKTNNFNLYWNSLSKDWKRISKNKTGEFSEYSVDWCNLVSGNPKLEKINSVEVAYPKATVECNYSKDLPFMGQRVNCPKAEFYLINENNKWVIDNFNSGAWTRIKEFKSFNPKIIEMTLPN